MGLKDAFAPFFKVGAAISGGMFEKEREKQHVMEQYNSLTCENDMKPEAILDEAQNQRNPEKYKTNPAVCFDRVRPYLEFAKQNGMQMRGHTLVWYSQTPDWFFRENYQKEDSAPLADRETMLARMENYIQSVLTYVQENYPGVVYAWDVVNEAILEDGFRKCLWVETVGEDYVEKAFTFASRYAAEGISLFYNDYETYLPWKKELICRLILEPLRQKKLIHGVGMQSHLNMQLPELKDYWDTICCFGKTGLEVQVTELDIHNAVNTPESMHELAERYKQVFELLVKAKMEQRADITAVTLWGTRDEESWLELYGKENSYPLLFHKEYEPKEAYTAVLSVSEELKKNADGMSWAKRYDK